jgi:DNA repair protein RadC
MRIPVVYENPRRRSRKEVDPPAVDLPAAKAPCACGGGTPVDENPTGGIPAVPGPFTQVVKDPGKFQAVMDRAHKIGYLDSDGQLAALLLPDLETQDQETFVVVGLDMRNELRSYTEVARGVRDCAMVGIPDVLRAANIEGCTGFVVAHNHPSGDAHPSKQDRDITKRIALGADAIGLVFVDHLVIGSKGSYFTFRDNKLKRVRA